MSAGDLAVRLGARMTARPAAGEKVLVAFSGGLDSLVLLHLLRFAPELPRTDVVAAHFDHRMRAGSAADARWAAERAGGWGVPIEVGEAAAPPPSEEAARDARYAFLDAARARVGARWILTAHHADDQAETVLFRVARGTGLAGLRGIPARRGALLRPLLPFWRAEIEAYAHAHGLEPRPDPSNSDLRFARNAIRAEVMPRLESAVAPGARRALVRLARLAAREERAWRPLVARLMARATVARHEDRIVVSAETLAAAPPAVRARALRVLVRRLGGVLDEAGTRAASEFTRLGASGRSHPLPGGLELAREFDRLVVARVAPAAPVEDGLEIAGPESGEGGLRLGGRGWSARWTRGPLPGSEGFALADLRFPLLLRGRRPGDRIRLPYGSKKLKKLLGEARIPLSERDRLPVLVDARGRVLWLPGVARAAGTGAGPGGESLHIGLTPDGPA